ncbi:hypothetical protein FP2506_02190 [Fulvimarina pelagi HTCC2506]|uniref:Uncharacterized protein n=2 Tax=Fulvimarina pelagi TaxID=217511 RepID=Q0FYI2_9HYPH|nr:hypothetical protein [Fulvimarina pelagi]EAU40013.1 hypothetical protein FP2506_02190 [Fulvimarina pelagi HTCC2506]BAT31055.1 hypothetical protein [Fulvimarina pelagi]
MANATTVSLEAYSGTATAVTGDIELTETGITFEDGTVFGFGPLDGTSIMIDGEWRHADIWLSDTPDDPVLSSGNRLCGEGSITFVAVWDDAEDEWDDLPWNDPEDDLVTIAVFTTQDIPEDIGEMCASYVYSFTP